MVRTRLSITVAVLVCLVGTQLNAQAQTSPRPFAIDAPAPRPPINFLPPEFRVASEQIYQGPPVPMYRHSNTGALTAIMIGAAAAITGTALVVYANRPECSFNQYGGNCYGTKVFGGAMIAGGIVGLVVGAVAWK